MSQDTKAAPRKKVQIPLIEDFLHAGAHFGHRTSRWHPAMKPYIYGERNGVHIIDVIKSMKMLDKALEQIQSAVDRGSVLIVGTKGQAATLVEQVAKDKGAFYINRRWPGGLFTNFDMIKKSVASLVTMEEDLATGSDSRVKKEELLLKRDVERLNKMYEGLKFMDRLPELVIVIDSKVEKNAIREAASAGIPVVALVDTNCDPTGIKYPVPANDDSLKSIKMFVELFAQAIEGGKKADSVISLRNSHAAKIETLQKELEHKKATEELQREEDRERLKALRAGKLDIDISLPESTIGVKKDGVVRVVEESKESAPVKVDALDVSSRTIAALKAAGYKDTAKLKGMSRVDLLGIEGVGPKAVEELEKVL